MAFTQIDISSDSIGALKSNPNGSAKLPLLGANGKPKKLPIVVGTASGNAAAVVHKCAKGALDEVYLWAANYSDSSAVLTLSINDANFTASNTIVSTLNSRNGLILVYPGVPHGKNITIYAKSNSASAINLFGFVVRYFPIDRKDKSFGFGKGTSGNSGNS